MTPKKRIEKLEKQAKPEDEGYILVWILNDGTYQVGDEIMTEAEYIARHAKNPDEQVIHLKWID